MTDKVLTANRLVDGVAVWLDANGQWSEKLRDAFIARHAEAELSLEAIGKRDFAGNLVVDVNLIEVQEVAGEIRPLRLRERVRAAGPTIAYADGFAAADPAFIAV